MRSSVSPGRTDLTDGPLRVARRGAILEVVLDRPKANAIDAVTSRAMGQVFAQFRDDPELRVAILSGGGEKFFSAGWDLNAAAAGGPPAAGYRGGACARL